MKVRNDDVKCVWESKCDCNEIAIVTPDWYEDNGTPICPECGEDMTYSHTEIDTDGLINKAQAIDTARSLVDDGSNEEYTRGIAELISYLYANEDELPSDIVDSIISKITK